MLYLSLPLLPAHFPNKFVDRNFQCRGRPIFFGHVFVRARPCSAIQAAASDKEVGVAEAKGLRRKLNKVVLSCSDDSDTSVIVPWLRENYGCEVVCFTADVGQGITEIEGLEAKAKASGACQLVVKDLTEEFVKDYIFPCLRAGAVYEHKYGLATFFGNFPVIAKAMADVAREVGADAFGHGCTGKGNDQVRFEFTFFALNPELQVMAPWREWDITGSENAIEYAKKHNMPVPVTKNPSHEGDILEDTANEPRKDMYMMSVDPEDAPDQPEYVEIGIVSGIPVSVNGKKLSPATLLSEAKAEESTRHLEGLSSSLLYVNSESWTLDLETIQVKDKVALKYAELVYAGRWFDPLRESVDIFLETITETTSGSVTLKLDKGSVTVACLTSPHSLDRQRHIVLL